MTPKFVDRLSPREKRLLALCAAAVLLFIIYVTWPESEPEGVELATLSPASTTPALPPPVPAPPPVVAPAPVQVPPAATPQPAPAAAPTFVLQGVFGGGPRGGAALIATGRQTRRVPIGREVAPGVVLKSVGLNHAVLSGPGGETRLELARSGAVTGAPAAPPQ